MIAYHQFFLNNGLQVLVHQDQSTSLAVLNLAYNVGSRDENENKTGFAHLFEHLMFGGSQHISSFDEPLQLVGGDNNAFTSPDLTNYYLTVPANNLETAFWLESDRMLGLSFDPKVLQVQKSVVIEEFKQRYLNQPYGDVWLKLRPLAFRRHPYRWATIGKDISHIENATMDEVKNFFGRFYHPANAVLVVAGKVDLKQVQKLSEKWFGPIKPGAEYCRSLPEEPKQTEARLQEVVAKVPVDAVYQGYHMPQRFTAGYHQADLLSDILGRGKSSRLFQKLVKRKSMYSAISSYVTGSLDPGLLVIQGNLNPGFSCEQGHTAIREVVEELISEGLSAGEMRKVKNQAESSLAFSQVPLLNRAMNLALCAIAGDPDYINREMDVVAGITQRELKDRAIEVLTASNSSTLYYKKTNK